MAINTITAPRNTSMDCILAIAPPIGRPAVTGFMVGRFEMAKKVLNIKSKTQNVKCKSERPFCIEKEKHKESVLHEFLYPISNIPHPAPTSNTGRLPVRAYYILSHWDAGRR